MKAKTLQIFWHNKEPVLALDFHGPSGLLATGGADKEIRIWRVNKRAEKAAPQQGDKQQPQHQQPQQQQQAQPAGATSAQEEQQHVSAEYLFSLCHHNYAVNALRFSPAGDMLVSGADGGEIALWKWIGMPASPAGEAPAPAPTPPSAEGTVPAAGAEAGPGAGAGTVTVGAVNGVEKMDIEKEPGKAGPPLQARDPVRWRKACLASMLELESRGWKVIRSLSRHERDVLDLAWSPDGGYLISGSVDNSAIIWDVARACPEHFLQDHGHYVQGVAWDPLGAFVVTSSSDRSTRIYTVPYGAPPGWKPLVGSTGSGKGKSGKAPSVKCQHFLQRIEIPLAGEATETAGAAAGAPGAAPQPGAPSAGGVPAGNPAPPQAHGTGPAAGSAAESGAGAAPPPPKVPKVYLFHDESMPSFFRRCSWSPDGSLLVLPAGLWRAPWGPDGAPLAAAGGAGQAGPAATTTVAAQQISTCFVFARADLTRPLIQLPSISKPLVAVRFCPLFFRLDPPSSPLAGAGQEGGIAGAQKDSPQAPEAGALSRAIQLPYAFVFAVASTNSVTIYSTQRTHPVALLGGLHYAPITDLAWSSDGLTLAIASQDGYCTVVSFKEGELGVPLPTQEIPAQIQSAIALQVGSSLGPPAVPGDKAANPEANGTAKGTEEEGRAQQGDQGGSTVVGAKRTEPA